ncbi:MAG: NAD(P)-dependent oxidoreductase [Oligoflexia bacterium]|nr:NAD(P)-dependent oxidoreductase [Oligoflexia bacterium]
MKILVTGSTGFIGSHICEQLASEGHQVLALVRKQKKWENLSTSCSCSAKKFKFITPIFDSIDPEGSWAWIDRLPADLDVVVHTAGVVHSHRPSEFYRTNLTATSILVEKLKRKYAFNHKLKFIFLSSLSAAPTIKSMPVGHYGRSKLLAEEFLIKNAPSNWNVEIIRPPIVIGPRDPQLLHIFKIVKKGYYFVVGPNGEMNQYSFICVYDLVKYVINQFTQKSSSSSSSKSSTSPSPIKINIHHPAYPSTITYKEFHLEMAREQGVSSLKKITIPRFLLKPVAYTISALTYICPPLSKVPLTADKSKELLEHTWLVPSDSDSDNDNYSNNNFKWNLNSSVKVTIEDYNQRGLLN